MNDELVRASDAERQAVAERLRAALAEGRLDLASYEERTATALAAATRGELVALTADLPEPEPEPLPDRVAEDTRAWYAEWRYWLGGAVVMFAIWGVECLRKSDLTKPWPLIPLGIWAAILIAEGIAYDPNRKRRA